jgi:predicted ATPase/DNA-binding CsgD family transcriptional regulator
MRHRIHPVRDEERALRDGDSLVSFPGSRPSGRRPSGSTRRQGTNLPAALTSFVGREREIRAITRLLATARLLTLTGSGGVGKTRLALAVAAGLPGLFAAGVWLVELAALADPDLLAQAVASVLGVPEASRPILDALIDTVGDRPMLLVLDNCEHLLDTCAALFQPLLLRCPRLQILATSRQPLGLEGETVYRVPSLSLPARTDRAARLQDYEATALFIERAATAQPSFALTPDNAPAIEDICSRLDGIPLAIELAAPWVNVLSAQEIAARLDDRFRLLTGGSRTALPRQQTLRGTLDWSYGLLSEPERVMLRWLAVFEGGWTLDAAEAVCAGDPIQRDDVLRLLAGLVDKSLVLADLQASPARYELLETTREYAIELLDASGEAPGIHSRHAAYYLSLAQDVEPQLFGPRQLEAMERLDLEADNHRSAVRWAVEAGDPQTELQLVASLWDYWWMRGRLREGQRLVEDALDRGMNIRSNGRAKALHGAAILAAIQGDLAHAHGRFEQSAGLFRHIGDRVGLIRPLCDLGTTYAFFGDFARGRETAEEAIGLAHQTGDQWGLAYALHMAGQIALAANDYASAARFSEESAVVWRRLGDGRGLAHELIQLSIAARCLGDEDRALILAREALDLFRSLGETWGILGGLVVAAAAEARQDQMAAAARILAAADAFSKMIGAALVIPHWQMDFDLTRDAAQEALGEVDFDAAWSAGAAMPIDQAIDFALSGSSTEDSSQTPAPMLLDALGILTPREREVAALLAQGLSDHQVASTLVISDRTAENHVHHILYKLGLRSRGDLVDFAPVLGLIPAEK